MPSLCRFRDVFGVPGQGVHRVRVFGLAAVDLIGTLVVALVVARWMRLGVTGCIIAIVAAFALGVLAHRLFCVDTALNVRMFGRHVTRD